jgi:hypothetical protein
MDERDTWNAADERAGDFTRTTSALVNGAEIALQPGGSMKDAVINLARDAGFGKFRVLLNGTEIKPSQAPELINEGDHLELRPYDVAGR